MASQRLTNIMLALATAACLAISFHLDDPHALTDAVSDAKADAVRQARRDLNAAKLCRHEHGPGTGFTWTSEGELVCIPRHVASIQP